MKKTGYIFVVLFICLFCLPVQSQNRASEFQTPGAPAGVFYKNLPVTQTGIVGLQKTNISAYSTTVYTFGDITIFSYFDSTTVTIINSSLTEVGNATLKADTLYTIKPGSGIYSIAGNKPYSVLIGDAITNYVNGYFALDQGGRGTSTKLNTWMMNGFGGYDDHFIVFAYNDSTEYTIKELSTGNFVYAGTLNNSQFLNFPNVSSIAGKSLQVVSNKPVSALSYTDQDYYVPSSNGTFAGTLFYGYSGVAGGWTNSITLTSYADNNYIKVTNLETSATIDSFTLGLWQVRTIPVTQRTFWKVESTGRTTAANIPFAGYSSSYAYMARAADSTGKNFGSSFIVPTIGSTVSVFSFDDNNTVHIMRMGDTTYPYTSPTVVADTTLQTGMGYIFSAPSGHNVYRIYADKNISVLQSNSGWGADFMPLGYSLELTDLSISGLDINFNPTENQFNDGDQIDINVTIRNDGTLDASNVNVAVYDGDPDAGSAPLIGTFYIPSLAAGGNYTSSVKCMVPDYSQYHYVYVKVDAENTIQEYNESNNKASRSFKTNADLSPPLAVTISAPSAISPSGNIAPGTLNKTNDQQALLSITANVFNIGTSTQTNVNIKFKPQDGLTLVTGPVDTTIASLPVASSIAIVWTVSSNQDSSGFNLYSLDVASDSAAVKEVKRTVIVLDTTPPAIPAGLTATTTSGKFQLNWTNNSESDLGGYKIYYGTDGVNWNGTGAAEGNSPVAVSKINQFYISGLPVDTKFYFAIKAFDVSNNESNYSTSASATVVNIENTNSGIPADYALSQNYPNPFNPTTRIRISIPFESNVKLTLYNLLGQEVKQIVNTTKNAGTYEVTFDASNISSGVYYYRLTANSTSGNKQFTNVKKLILLK